MGVFLGQLGQDRVGWQVLGTVPAAVRAAQAVGWTFRNACTLVDHKGVTLNLHEGSPALLQSMYRARWTEVLWTEALGAKLRSAASTEEARHLITTGLDLHQVGRLVRSKAKNSLTHPCKAELLRFVCGAVGAGKRACTLCGARDSAEHRLSGCGHPEAGRARESHLTHRAADFTSARACDSLALLRGWRVGPPAFCCESCSMRSSHCLPTARRLISAHTWLQAPRLD